MRYNEGPVQQSEDVPRDKSAVARAMEDLDETVSRIAQAVERLGERLLPVRRRTDHPTGEKREEEKTALAPSPIVGNLRHSVDRLYAARDAISEITEELEL